MDEFDSLTGKDDKSKEIKEMTSREEPCCSCKPVGKCFLKNACGCKSSNRQCTNCNAKECRNRAGSKEKKPDLESQEEELEAALADNPFIRIQFAKLLERMGKMESELDRQKQVIKAQEESLQIMTRRVEAEAKRVSRLQDKINGEKGEKIRAVADLESRVCRVETDMKQKVVILGNRVGAGTRLIRGLQKEVQGVSRQGDQEEEQKIVENRDHDRVDVREDAPLMKRHHPE